MFTYKLVLEYDGTAYVGWQIQKNGISIQEVLESALSQLFQSKIHTIAAGRTDAGVHAKGQVASFQVERYLSDKAILRGVNALLPDDIRLKGAEIVSEQFHARYSAVERCYRYYISLNPTVFNRFIEWNIGYQIDFEKLDVCASVLIGEHNFSSFSKTGTPVVHHRCKVFVSRWIVGNSLIYEIRADRFLRGMVRLLVGTMIEVARGYRSVEDFKDIVASAGKIRCGMAAPACGLFLEEVRYSDNVEKKY